MEMDKSLTHINESGEMNIVDISDKVETKREALAEGYINLNKEILEKIKNEKIRKYFSLFGSAWGKSKKSKY